MEIERGTPRYIVNIGCLALPQPFEGSLLGEPVKIKKNLWLEIKNGRISRIGHEGEPEPPGVEANNVFDAYSMLATPGLIDSHTHPVFLNFRQSEFVRRCRGETYQQIAAAGGGILSSIRGVREANEEMLSALIFNRLEGFLEFGVTAIEAKSGYGLSLADELKSLRSLKKAALDHPIEVSPTLLAAHVIPPEFRDNPDGYVDLVCNSIIPQAVEEKLANAVDVFLDDSAFNPKQTRRIFKVAKEAGLDLRLHADQFSVGKGAEIAAEFGALTVDHMDYTDENGIEALAKSGVTVVLLPGAVFFLGLEHYAPARMMIEKGCKVALATDFNPGSSPTQSLPLMMSLACIKMGMTPQEALWAATMGGAYATKRQDELGSLMPGYQADICLWNAEDVEYLSYAYGSVRPEVVFKRGEVVSIFQ
ncbi:MAG: imidazolonepropionase [Candidatus Hatepunaea meridiana]|nr:imidazolonepropionase [Candidatus Hatepunaea meridiana]